MDELQIEQDTWPPADCPELAWPALADEVARLSWYRRVILAYSALWGEHSSAPVFAPVGEDELLALEARLACPLPVALRRWHREFGVLNLAETLCSVDAAGYAPIEPLLDAYPGIPDLCDDDPHLLAQAGELVAFGDYLGNGNLFCFHRETGEVYYFDHDSGAMLTRFFDEVGTYLDALMIVTLSRIHEDDEQGEALLAERFGQPLVRKWMY